jgi:hypothetical protein
MLAQKIGMDLLGLRLKNAARPGTQTVYGPKIAHGGYPETVEVLLDYPAYKVRSGRTRGAVLPPASGSTAAGSRARRCRSTRTVP